MATTTKKGISARSKKRQVSVVAARKLLSERNQRAGKAKAGYRSPHVAAIEDVCSFLFEKGQCDFHYNTVLNYMEEHSTPDMTVEHAAHPDVVKFSWYDPITQTTHSTVKQINNVQAIISRWRNKMKLSRRPVSKN